MHPILFTLGKLTVYSYGTMMALGILTAIAITLYRGKKRGFNQEHLTNIIFYGVIGGILGAKLLFLVTEVPTLIKDPSAIKEMIRSGFVVYGAIIGGAVAALIYCRNKGLAFFEHFDLIAPSIAIAQGIGRLGCFFAGCCYGAETSSHFSITFRESLIAPNGVSLYPTQLISSAGDFLIGIILLIFASKSRKKGEVSGLYMILYSIGRFAVEFLRGDPRGKVGILSTSQFICIIVLISGIIIYRKGKIKAPASHN